MVKKAPAGLPGILDVKVRYDEKDATIRYVPGKTTVDQILARYAETPFAVVPAGPVVTITKTKHGEIRGWTQRAKAADKKSGSTAIQLTLGYNAKNSTKLDMGAKASLQKPPAAGLGIIEEFKRINLTNNVPKQPTTLRFQAQLYESVVLKPGETIVPVDMHLQEGQANKSVYKLNTILRTTSRSKANAEPKTAEAPLIGGKLNLRLGHLSTQNGSVSHFHQSISKIPGVGAVRPHPSVKKPGATVFLRAGEPIDLWHMYEQLRSQSIDVAGIVPEDFDDYQLRVELPRWKQGSEITQSPALRDDVANIIKGIDWAGDVSIAGGGVQFRPNHSGADLVVLLERITKSGAAPVAVWLVPSGVPIPKGQPPIEVRFSSHPKLFSSEAHPVVEFDLGHAHFIDTHLPSLLHEQLWASKVDVTIGKTPLLRTWVADRKYANLSPLLSNLRTAGHVPRAIRLRGFTDLRIQLEFAHISGDVVYSKPPRPRNKSKTKKNTKTKKPFVPQPIAMATSSQGHQAIKEAIQNVSWIKGGAFLGCHTRFEYRGGPYKVLFALQTGGEDSVRLDELIDALQDAGFPPKKITVSRLFPGIPFGKPLPRDLPLVDAFGKKRNLASYQKSKRPLVVTFVSLKTKSRSKYSKYKADPKLFGRLGQTFEKYRDRIEFIAINSNKHDKFADVVKFWKETGVSVPLLHDQKGTAGAVFNMQIAPPPHMFVFDGGGCLRYAGEPHSHWQELEKNHDDYLAQALERVLAGEYRDNGAVFYNKSPCNCSHPKCGCPKCGCGSSCRCGIKHCGTGF